MARLLREEGRKKRGDSGGSAEEEISEETVGGEGCIECVREGSSVKGSP